MAELALAIIPLGLQACSGLVSYLGSLRDRNDAFTRLKRQAESLEGSFQLLDAFLNKGQLDPATSQAAAHALRCLESCEIGLKELRDLEQKLSSPIKTDPSLQDKVKSNYRKLTYPLRQAQLTQLENALDSLCTPLTLAVQNLQLEMQVQNTTGIQQTGTELSNLSTAIGDLGDPISNIQSQIPHIQSSVDGIALQIIPQINSMIQAQFRTQMEEVRLSFQEANSTALQLHAQATELLSQLRIDDHNHSPAVYRLASKPSALATLAASASACSCRARRFRTRKTLTFGPFYLADETTTEVAHYQDCHFYINSPKYSRAQSLRFTGLARLIDKAVELTLHTTMGAGGFSISPYLACSALVDKEESPAFRVLTLLKQSYMITGLWMYCDPDHFFGSLIQKFQAIFRSGRARPTDIDSQGRSLLHSLVDAMRCFSENDWNENLSSHRGLKSLIDFLIAVGTPLSVVSSDGRSAFYLAAKYPILPASILTQLCDDDVEMPWSTKGVCSYSNFNPKGNWGDRSFFRYEGVSPRLDEALFGPLSLAILQNDTDEVKRLITRDTEYLEEKNFYPDTPIFMTLEKPEMLQILAERANPEQLVQQTHNIKGNNTPLGEAIWKSQRICQRQGTADMLSCPCTAAVRILLAADCPIMPYRDFWGHTLNKPSTNLFERASGHCKVFIAEQLRSHRRELRDLAQKKLLRWEYNPFYETATELDFQSLRLDRLLREKKLTSFGRLSASLPGDTNESHIFRPVYLDLTNPEDAAMFRDLGFPEIATGWTHQPLSNHLYTCYEECATYILDRLEPRYAMWLYNHRPNIWKLLCECLMPDDPAFILAEIILRYSYSADKEEMLRYIVDPPLNVEQTDGLTCQCSLEGGCTPFAQGIRCINPIIPRRPVYLQTFVEDYGEVLSFYQHTTVFRQAAFDSLEMVHTCPQGVLWAHYELREDDFYVSSDDVAKSEFLNDVVMEFRNFILNDAPVSHENTESGTHQEGTINHQRVLEFWRDVWPLRKQAFEENLMSTWNPDLEVLGDLGVSLWLEQERDDKVKEPKFEVTKSYEEPDYGLWEEIQMIE